MFIVRIEQVYLVRIKRKLDNVLRTSCTSGRYSCCQRDTFTSEVEVRLSTHHFGNVYCSFDHTCLSIGEEHFFIVNVLGTDTKDNFLVNIVLKSFCISLSTGQFNLELCACCCLCIFRTVCICVLAVEHDELSVDEVHLR